MIMCSSANYLQSFDAMSADTIALSRPMHAKARAAAVAISASNHDPETTKTAFSNELTIIAIASLLAAACPPRP